MKKLKETILRIVLVLSLGFVILLVGLVGIVAPDQIRSVPKPVISIGHSNDADAPAETVGKEGNEPGVSSESAAQETYPIPLDQALQKDYRPYPDLSVLPEELRDLAMEWNSAVTTYTAALLALRLEQGRMSYSEYASRWKEIDREYVSSRNCIYRRYNEIGEEYGRELFHGESATESLYSRRMELREVLNRVVFEGAVEHEDWTIAIHQCAQIAKDRTGDYEKRDPYWWDAEVYYLRKLGFRGRWVIVSKSLDPLKDKFPMPLRNTLGSAYNRVGRWLEGAFAK